MKLIAFPCLIQRTAVSRKVAGKNVFLILFFFTSFNIYFKNAKLYIDIEMFFSLLFKILIIKVCNKLYKLYETI